jgi:hypothetical protein
MTKPIPTFNILIAFDKKVFSGLKKAIKQGSFSSYLGAAKDYVLFNNISDNFIKLAHAYSFQQKEGSETDNFTITLELLDPGRVFEQNYIANSLKQLLAPKSGNLFDATDTEEEIARLQNILDHQNENDPDFWKNMGAVALVDGTIENDLYNLSNEKRNKRNFNIVAPGEEDETPEQIKERGELEYQKLVNEFEAKRQQYITEIQARLARLQNPKGLANFYISYGCGDNLDNWAGPFLCTMTGAKIGFSAETGFRTVTVLFTVDSEFPGLTPIDSSRFELGRDIQIFGQSPLITTITQDPVNFTDFFYGGSDDVPLLNATKEQKDREEKAQASRVSQLNSTGSSPGEEGVYDYHYAISECIKDYLKKATANKANIVVLFPDINLLMKPLEDSYNREYRFNSNLYGNAPIYVKLPSGKEQAISKRRLYVVPKILKDLGFDITSEITSGDKIITYSDTTLISPNGTPDANAKVVERVTDAARTAKNLQISLVKKPGQTFMDPLKIVTAGLSTGLQVIKPVFMIENNVDFIKDFKEYCDKHGAEERARRQEIESNFDIRQKIRLGDLSGRRQEILDIDPEKPILIYGDKTMIDRFFYGKIKLEKIGLFKFGFGGDEATLAEIEKSKKAEDPTNIYFNYNYLFAYRDKKFASDEYFQIANKYFQIAKQDNCFNSYSLPKSQFAFDVVDQQRLEQANIPVFKFGVQDPNVLDLDMDVNHYYFNILNKIVYETTKLHRGSRGTVNKTDEGFNALLELDKFHVSNIIKNFTVIKPDGTKGLSYTGIKAAKELSLFAETSEEDIEAVFASLMALSGDKTLVKNLEWWKKENPTVHFLTMLEEMSQLAYRGTIRTLPFFHLSNSVGSINPALLFVRESSILGINKTNSISDVLNGLWVIYGYEHSIGKGEAYSTFHITKDIRIQMPKPMMPIGKKSTEPIEVKEAEE